MKDVEGMYYIFLAVDHDRLPPNRHLSTDLFDCCGDVFLLKMVNWPEKRAADYDDPIDCLRHLRHEYLFPEYADVDDRVLESDLLAATVRELLRGAVLAMRNRGEMVDEDKVGRLLQFGFAAKAHRTAVSPTLSRNAIW